MDERFYLSDAIFPRLPLPPTVYRPSPSLSPSSYKPHTLDWFPPARKGFILGQILILLIAPRVWLASRLLFHQIHFLFPSPPLSFPSPTLPGLLAPPSISLTLAWLYQFRINFTDILRPSSHPVSLPSRHWITRGESLRVLQPLDTGINGSDVTHLSARYDSRRRWKTRSLENYTAFGMYRPDSSCHFNVCYYSSSRGTIHHHGIESLYKWHKSMFHLKFYSDTILTLRGI